jgi:hypothetical protein
VVPGPAAACRPCSGVTLNVEVTYALPPPVYCGCAEAAGPITATEPPPDDFSGSVPRPFFSSTVPASATAADTAWCAGVVTVALVDPVGGLLKSLNRNISVRMRVTIWFSVAMLTWPASTAASSAGP